jgi:hypothetical protein
VTVAQLTTVAIVLVISVLAAVFIAARRARPVEEPTREHDVLDLDESRQSRQIHGRTASELAAEKAAATRAEEWEWSRITQDLSCDADFRRIATRLESEFPA